jgi:hypothetical protein
MKAYLFNVSLTIFRNSLTSCDGFNAQLCPSVAINSVCLTTIRIEYLISNQTLNTMKKICLILMITACAATMHAQQLALVSTITNLKTEMPAFAWDVTAYDFGKIQINKPVTHEFKFTNTGDSPLVISSVQASCGCTVAEYSKDPIAPGAQGFVKATYNAAKVGVFTKTVTVNANAEENMVQLVIKGEVVE